MGNGPVSTALRLAGYVKCPALWVTQEQLELIYYMAQQNFDEIKRIKEQAWSAHNGSSTLGMRSASSPTKFTR
jgi:hypothetical protein